MNYAQLLSNNWSDGDQLFYMRHLLMNRRSPKRRPIDLALNATRADMKPVFILITNGNLDFELGHGLRGDCGKWHKHRNDVEICFVHTTDF